MAEVVTSISARIRLDNGTDSDGNQLYVNESMPSISTAGYTDNKFVAVAEAVEAILTKPIEYLQKTQVSTVTEDE